MGSAVAGAWRAWAGVVVVDEGDLALRASRGNFALVWVQSKGLGMSAYARWTVQSVGLWTAFATSCANRPASTSATSGSAASTWR